MSEPAEQQPCQSCAMPLRADADRGSEAGGGRNADYCRFCYAGGRFIVASLTLEQQLGWESVYINNNEDFGPESLLGRASDRGLLLPRLMNGEVAV